jgi:hypothetical protein
MADEPIAGSNAASKIQPLYRGIRGFVFVSACNTRACMDSGFRFVPSFTLFGGFPIEDLTTVLSTRAESKNKRLLVFCTGLYVSYGARCFLSPIVELTPHFHLCFSCIEDRPDSALATKPSPLSQRFSTNNRRQPTC